MRPFTEIRRRLLTGGDPRSLPPLMVAIAWGLLGGTTALFPGLAGASRASAQENCQLQADPITSFNLAGMSDLGIPPNGTAIVDDFVPLSPTLTTITVFGTYLDAKGDGPPGPQGYEQHECVWKVPPEQESFRVRIYEDGGRCAGWYSNGQPCQSDSDCPPLEWGYCLYHQPSNLVSEQSVSGASVTRAPVGGAGFETTYGFGMQSWTLTLQEPVTLNTAGTVYWLEVASDRNTVEDESTCYWHWWQTYQEGVANDWARYGTNDFPEWGGYPGTGHVPGAGKALDLQFCLGGPAGALEFTAPVAPTGSCCDCDNVCTDDVTLADCSEVIGGAWNLGWTCADWYVCAEFVDDCYFESAIVALDGVFPFDTTCYTTDVPESQAEEGLGKDIWFHYTASCTGELVASMCMSGNEHGSYDSFMTIFHDPDNPYYCECPGIDPPPDWIVWTSDEGCNGIVDGGAGIIDGIAVDPGEFYLIRVSGHGLSEEATTSGRGVLDVRCMPSACYPLSPPPQPETLALPGDPVNHKVRYLSFHGGDPGRNQAVRVTFDDLPAPYEAWNGTVMWVQQPEIYCENSGIAQAPSCPNNLGLSDLEFWGAAAGCEPYFTDWSYFDGPWFTGQPGVHVFHEGIVPQGLYQVQFIDEDCSIDVEEYYSTPLSVTMSRWGDLVKDCSTNPCGAPDGAAGIVDLTAVLDKWKNLWGCVSKTRADLEGSPAGDHRVPDQSINITDVTYCLGAFLGETYPPPGFPGPSPPPCQP